MTAVPLDTTVPWAPEDLPIPADVLAAHWHYAVLEEIVDEVALFRRWPWPVVDQLGHLIWPQTDEHATYSATADVDDLRTQVYEPSGIRRRPRCGDTFAITATVRDVWRRGGRATHLDDLLGDQVYDISADAREAAKIAYQGSLGPVQTPDAADDQAVTQTVAMLRARTREPLQALTMAIPPRHEPRRAR
jgi:hypothetical protein